MIDLKIVNVYIVYDLDDWPKNYLRNFTLKNCLFGVNNIVKSNNKEKYAYSGQGIAFDGKGEWSFGNYTARNIIIFRVDNSSSSHRDNLKNDFLMLGDGPSFGVDGRFGASEKKIDINFIKAKTKVCLSLHIILMIVIYL